MGRFILTAKVAVQIVLTPLAVSFLYMSISTSLGCLTQLKEAVMRKGQSSKVKNMGKVGCAGVLVLGMALLNPLVGTSVYAEETEDYGVDAQTLTGSTVNISFSPTSGSASLTPITEAGTAARMTILANVEISNSGGYGVYLSSKSGNLTGVKSGAKIGGIVGSSTFENLAVNTWGYFATEDGYVPDTAAYRALAQGQGDLLLSRNGNVESARHTLLLSFAAKVGIDKPADTYKDEVTLSVVSSPLEISSLKSLSTMQGMTPEICASSDLNETKQLVDIRDGKSYWVTKMADGNCWMTQNLDLNITTAGLSAVNSDIVSDWNASSAYSPSNSESSITASTISTVATATRSWDFGYYILSNPTAASDCGAKRTNISECTTQVVAVGGRTASTDPDFYKNNGNKTYTATEYDAHYLVGNYYQWNAATAGTGGTITSGQATGSICPKGWKLPTTNNTNSGSFSKLVTSGNVGNDIVKLTSAPYYFTRTGNINQNVSLLLAYVGNGGNYWSSTPYSTATNAFDLNIAGATSLVLNDNASRYFGLSVRCIAK